MNTLLSRSCFWAALLTLSLSSAHAASLDGVTLPDQISAGGKTLYLNGLGTRKATIFKVKVYIAGLYVEKKSTQAGAIVNSPEIKQLKMKFVHDVSLDKLKDAWNTGLTENCLKDCETLTPAREKLFSYLKDVKSGDAYELTFFPDRVEVILQGDKKDPIPGKDFSQVLLATWIGKHPPTEELKSGLLGTREN